MWLAVPGDQLKIIDCVIQMLYNASLMINDIEDDVQLIYGVPQTINTANYVYFLDYKELAKLRRQCEDGDVGMEIMWQDLLQCPMMEEYTYMVNNKTGGGFRVFVRLMMALAAKNLEVNFIPLVNIIGVYFQISDDYMNLQSTEYNDHKGFAEDLTGGKFSFPIVYRVHVDDQSVLQKCPTTPTLKHYTIIYRWTKTKLFDYMLMVMQNLKQQLPSYTKDPKVQVVKDENLTWEQFNESAPHMVTFMKDNDWPDDRVNMHIAFWSTLQNHRWHHDFDTHKQSTLLLYQAQQCKCWHLTIGSSNSWSIAKINQDLLNEARETIFNQFRMQILSSQNRT
ncbi:isoprenoid synthase domain-containing protein [Suillus fuscotomentosus]|uniref:(2E,6E)-farnesyl diphosphate synthase n=1 Tax=Suillus fuscotomentosus TaxID=1912939 RepID=A0AAD4EEF4_9AGAM|nr:isoprenoid synthase domain-containing protein [Suillus fuscotomentosus]KAG1903423.1 isoprenoid synthase domain-containing protein [Suillus fuscotomentosus]